MNDEEAELYYNDYCEKHGWKDRLGWDELSAESKEFWHNATTNTEKKEAK